MSSVCIISDNQFFSFGLRASLSFDDQVVIMTPEQVLSDPTCLNNFFTFYIFIYDRQAHLMVCNYLTRVNGACVFFINCREEDVILAPCFISSRIPVREVRMLSLITPVRLVKNRSFNMLSTINNLRTGCAAKGLTRYMYWVRNRTCTANGVHYHKKALLNALGIQRVSVHTFFLAEYISAGIRAAGVSELKQITNSVLKA